MATITITKTYDTGQILLEADLDNIISGIETFLNTTKINDDNIQNVGITASTKLIDLSVSTGKLADVSVTAAKLASDAVTTAKILNANVTAAKLAADVTTTFTPPGVIWDYAGTTAPTGWLFPDGSAVSRTTYAALFAVLSTTFGVGDGSTTFNLPDLRGRVGVGKDNMGGTTAGRVTNAQSAIVGTTLGASGGVETYALDIASMPAHNHTGSTGSGTTSAQTLFDSGGLGPEFTVLVNSGGDTTGGAHDHSIPSQGGGGTHQNMQPTLILNKIIKT